ncbi:DUF2145 domain-containing protein [Rhodoferax sp.]|jgi:hypothetical protein|uniref:DUF2145 domain-containing protein n=1 Tax=Rhodoferax sp. TaxID=50421 RepID=UPI003783CA17
MHGTLLWGRAFIVAVLLSVGLHDAVAGTACSDKPPQPESIQQAFQAAYKLHQKLEATQPQVGLVARVGQDLSKYGLRYSHIAFVRKDAASGQWRIVHLLNACNSNQSAIWNEGLANFFLDDLHAYEAMLIVPSPALQAKLLAIVDSESAVLNMHQPLYNMLAYPFSDKYQNSNQWALELLAQALSQQAAMVTPVANRKQAQQWLKLTNYEPTTLKLGAMTRLGARVFKANVAFDDHPNERRFADLIDTATVESMVVYARKVDPGSSFEVIK